MVWEMIEVVEQIANMWKLVRGDPRVMQIKEEYRCNL